jgi:hypothetical protein
VVLANKKKRKKSDCENRNKIYTVVNGMEWVTLKKTENGKGKGNS